MSEQFALIETRIISGLGILELPVNLAYRKYRIWINLIRFPAIDFPNAKFNPERSNYCNVLFMAQDYVYKEEILRYEKHVLEIDPNQSEAYIGSYLSCSLTSISNALAAIAVAVGLPPPVPGSPLFVEPVISPVTALYFACREEVAIQVSLFGLFLDVDCAASAPSGKQPAGAPAELPIVPPTTPVVTSPPYTPPDDDGNTVPNPLDGSPPVGDPNLRFSTQSWNRFDSCNTGGVVSRDIPLSFTPTSWTVVQTASATGCESVVPPGTAGRWEVNYTDGVQNGNAVILDSAVSPKNRSIVYDSGTLVFL